MQHKWKILQSAWQYPSKLASVVNEFGLLDLTAAILARRGYSTEASARSFLSPDYYHPALPESLPDLEHAAERIVDAYRKNERILLWGDIDTDGLTATAVVFEALNAAGMEVYYHIPERHGIHVETLREICQSVKPAVLLSCDTGTSAHAAANFVRDSHIDFLVADHHQLPPSLPPVHALVNPKRLLTPHPLEHLSGVGVAFLLVQHVYEKLGKSRELNLFSDLIALGIVADVVPLLADTRYLVQQSLKALRVSNRPALIALAEISDHPLSYVTENEIGFDFVPRLNSFGRLSHADNGFKLLTTRNAGEARILAAQADALNQKRRLLTRQIRQAVQEQIQKDTTLLNWSALVLENPHWEAGVISEAANQLAEEYERPVVLLVSGANETASGSVRAFGGFNVLTALDAVSDLLITFGGHEQAAGMSILVENIPAFRRRFSNALSSQQISPREIEIEGILSLSEVTLDAARNLEKLAPFGVGNLRPVFLAQDVQLVRSAKIGRDDQHRRLTVRESGGENTSVLWWNSSEQPLPEGTFELAYQIAPVIQEGQYELQITFVDWVQTRPPEVKPLSQIELIDCRESLDLPAMKVNEPSLVIWAEGYPRRDSPGLPFSELTPAEALLIYTAPFHLKILQAALKRVRPSRVYLFAEMPALNNPDELLSALVALLKAALEKMEGRIDIRQIAERLAQPEETIRLALENLADFVEIDWLTRSSAQIRAVHPIGSVKISPKLQQAIEETAAYRRYFRRAPTGNLLE